MLPARVAVRLGLRAATRNPELSFGKALLDAVGTVLSILPWLLGVALLLAAVGRLDAFEAVTATALALVRMRWALAGASLTVVVISWALGMAFWAGALPVLAADAELQRRPPPGHFWPLALRGFARVAATGAIAYGLLLLFAASLFVSAIAGGFAILMHASVGRFAMLALLVTIAIAFGVFLDILAALMLVRAAAFADTASKAFANAASMLGQRLGGCLAVELAFALLQLIVASAAALFSGIVASGLDPAVQILSVPLRLAVGLAFATVFAWITVARHGAFAALAADAEGLIELPPEPPPAPPVPAVLQRPEIIEGLPVIDGLPAPPPDEPDDER
jgi:hypothetical protein